MKQIDSGTAPVVVDVRSKHEFDSGHVPGAIHLPFFKQLFSGNDISSDQTEIIMLLTPHIVRTQELTASDLQPIYIGSQQSLGIGGPPPVIAAPEPEPTPSPAPAPTPGAAAPGGGAAPGTLTGPGGVQVSAPPGSTPVPGTVVVTPATPVPGAAPPTPAPNDQPAPSPAAPATTLPVPPEPAAQIATTSPGIGQAQIIISPPPSLRMGAGPYTVPISVTSESSAPGYCPLSA